MQQDFISGFEISIQQKRLWSLSKGKNVSPYIARCTLLITGSLNSERLRKSVAAIIYQYETLRTTLQQQEGQIYPQQVVGEPDIYWHEDAYDLSDLTSQEQDERREAVLFSMREKSFRLLKRQSLQCTLIKFLPDTHVLTMQIPAFFADQTTYIQLAQEISSHYNEHTIGQEDAEDIFQYTQVSSWQDELLLDEEGEAGREFWRKQPASFYPLYTCRLPFEQVQAETQEFQPEVVHTSLDQRLLMQLEQIGQAQDVSLSTVILAGWFIVLQRLAHQDDIVVGIACDGRKYEELRTVPGLLTKYLPLFFAFQEKPRFTEFLRQIDQARNTIYEWQEYFTWEFLDGIDKDNKALHYSPFGFEYNEVTREESAVSFFIHQLHVYSDRFNIRLSCLRDTTKLALAFHYDTRCFTREAIECIADELQALLSSIAASPMNSIDDLGMVSDRAKTRLLTEFNATSAVRSTNAFLLHRRFEEQVVSMPDAIAIVFEEEQLTYQQLNRRANHLAHSLQALGVGPGVLVGLCVARTIEMIVGQLGILKAGGAYVPLDPDYPQERLAFQLADAAITVLVTQKYLVPGLLKSGLQIVYLDARPEKSPTEKLQNPVCNSAVDDLAYVIYTSGSTGKPKGVSITHHSISRLFQSSQDIFHFTAQDVWTLFHSFAFDFSVWEIWGALIHGGRLIIVPHIIRRSPEAFYALLQTEGVTVLNQTPSAFHQLLDSTLSRQTQQQNRLCTLRLIIFGGEALDMGILRPWVEHYGDETPQLINMYGITETTVHVTWHRIWQENLKGASRSLIGKPLPDISVYLFNPMMHLVPIGMPGEIYVGGVGVARCYLNRSELTSERFVPHPFSLEPGARLYRSGDQACYLPDGELEYLGRIDQQVKIRGFRIELGEIEAMLDAHPTVKKAIVTTEAEDTTSLRLLSYIVPLTGDALDTEELSNYLRKYLPDHMLPSSYIQLDAIPLTLNGKIDRSNLPARTSVVMDRMIIPPSTPTEEILVGICSALLSISEISIDDNFFTIGGHSLLAIQLIARIRSTFNNVEIPIRQLFEHQSIKKIAALIDTELQQRSQLALPRLVQQRERGNLPLSFAQQRLWFLHQLDADSSRYHMPTVLHLQGILHISSLDQALQILVERHEILRTSFSIVNGLPRQHIASYRTPPLHFVDISKLTKKEQQREVERLIQQGVEVPFLLEEAPLLRIEVIHLNQEENILLLVMHHIISDGWSLGIFLFELSTLYQAFAASPSSDQIFAAMQSSLLAPLALQYADYASWQRDWLSGDVLRTQLSYWREHLAGAPDLLLLPTDHPRSLVLSSRGATYLFSLPASLAEALKALSRRLQVTLFMTLFAAFATLLSRYSGQTDLVIGTPIANRRLTETEALIGFFVNTLALRLDLGGDPHFDRLLQRVRDVTLAAYAHQDLPFELLVEELHPHRDLSHSPLFQVLFVLQNTPLPSLAFSGLDTQLLDLNWSATQFDLTLSLEEYEGELGAQFEYSTDLFEAATIERLARHWLTLLAAVVEQPEYPISQLPLLSSQERTHLLVDLNATQVPLPSQCYVHQHFEEQARRTPEAIAVIGERIHLSYQVLEQRANQLAHFLQEQGAGPVHRIGLCLPRTPELIIALLAVLKAGAAYVPLDPSYPAERLAFMVQDCEATLLLTQQELFHQLSVPLPSQTKCIFLKQIWPLLPAYSSQPPQTMSNPQSLAYMIYTSGSTGVPKGTQVEHQGICNMLEAQAQTFHLQAADNVLQFSSFSFDASIFEILMALNAGATLHLIQGERVPLGTDLLQFLEERTISVVTLPPSTLATLPMADLPHLNTIIVAGEACSSDLVQKWAATRRFFNAYGLTETSVWATVALCDVSSNRNPSIGHPIGNVEIYILDQQLQPTPIGVTGEMYIGGACLARGYLKRPDITAERFIPHPFSRNPGERLYKTGDLAYYRANGEIEYLGRLDLQIKLRGFRIEPEEIEAALNQYPQIQQSVVDLYEFTPSDMRLIAYITRRPGEKTALDSSQLRSYLQKILPAYMLPAQYVELPEFPLAPGGKVDRRALLSAVDRGSSSQVAAYSAPQSEQERAIAVIWQELLGVKDIGLHTNFFDLGGHSLLVVQLSSQLQQQFQSTLSLTELFQYATVAAQSAHLFGAVEEQLSLEQPLTRAEKRNRATRNRRETRKPFKIQ
jgi:amino acid adenylation domain-containing protein